MDEASGIVSATVAVTFTIETDGRLPPGKRLGDAICEVEEATDGYPSNSLIYCAHPNHFAHVLRGNRTQRVMGLRANVSRMNPAEPDALDTLDDSNPFELGHSNAGPSMLLPNLTAMGGFHRTDHRPVAATCEATGT